MHKNTMYMILGLFHPLWVDAAPCVSVQDPSVSWKATVQTTPETTFNNQGNPLITIGPSRCSLHVRPTKRPIFASYTLPSPCFVCMFVTLHPILKLRKDGLTSSFLIRYSLLSFHMKPLCYQIPSTLTSFGKEDMHLQQLRCKCTAAPWVFHRPKGCQGVKAKVVARAERRDV